MKYPALTLTFVGAFLVAGCTAPALDPDLSLHDRFVLTVLTDDDGHPIDALHRWQHPLMLQYVGPEEYRIDVERQLEQLAEIGGLPVMFSTPLPNIVVEISDRDTPFDCLFQVGGGHAFVHIWSELKPRDIRQCIAQELAQVLGPRGDLDGPLGSRSDTVFASYQTADRLTENDIAVLRVLYDDRLHHGMPRDEVLAVLPEIVADVEAAR